MSDQRDDQSNGIPKNRGPNPDAKIDSRSPGISCPKCTHRISFVIDSRGHGEGVYTRRRRACNHCHYRFTTYETVGVKIVSNYGESMAYAPKLMKIQREKIEGMIRSLQEFLKSITIDGENSEENGTENGGELANAAALPDIIVPNLTK